MDRHEIENIILGIVDIICENRELRRQNIILSNRVREFEEDLNNRLKESQNQVADILNCMIQNLN